jgi:hypothetical protein
MIPLLPELPSAPGPLVSGSAMPQAPALTGAGLDFAGLLGAALPERAGAGEPSLLAASTLSNLPTGKNVPEPGASLPPLPPPTPPLLFRPEAVRPLAPSLEPDDALLVAEATEIHSEIEAPMSVPFALPDAEPSTPAPAPQPTADIALPDLLAPAPAAAVPPPPSDARPARLQRAAAAPAARPENTRMPARIAMPPAPAEDAAQLQSASAPTASFAAAAPLPAPETAALTPAQALAAPPAMLTTPTPERIETARAPTPQLESTIAQVGDLREALRSARPEMTLRHGEFGFVALRLEQTGAQDWRAVLASRDPGFVPAIQAALAERAVAAASASADSGQFLGQQGGGQNGTSDQRYGASPNGGQGGSQPYLGHSANRDGEAAPDHRRPSTAAALAARAEEGEEVSGSPAGQKRGMFA